jgi:hypothetical protein
VENKSKSFISQRILVVFGFILIVFPIIAQIFYLIALKNYNVGDSIYYLYKDIKFFFFPTLIEKLLPITSFTIVGIKEIFAVFYYFISAFSFYEYFFLISLIYYLILTYKKIIKFNMEFVWYVIFFIFAVNLGLYALIFVKSLYSMEITYQQGIIYAQILSGVILGFYTLLLVFYVIYIAKLKKNTIILCDGS